MRHNNFQVIVTFDKISFNRLLCTTRLLEWFQREIEQKKNIYGLLFQRFCSKAIKGISLIAKGDSVIDVILFIFEVAKL